jgi:hypothetical protein
MNHLCSNSIVVGILGVVWVGSLGTEGEGWWDWFVGGYSVLCYLGCL